MEYGGRHRRREYDEKDEDREYEERQRELSERVRKFEERYRNSEESENTESESEEKDEDQEYEERQREISERVRRFEEKYRRRKEEESTEPESDEGQSVQKDLEGSGEVEKQENAEEHEKEEEAHEHDDKREVNGPEDCDIAREDNESCRIHYETVEGPESQETHDRDENTEIQQETEMEKRASTEVSAGEHEGDGEVKKPSEVPDDEERQVGPEKREFEHKESGREDIESEDKDEYDDLEKWVIKTMEEKGIDPDELRERWREKFVEDVEDELGEKDPEAKSEEEEKRASSREAETEEGYSTYEDGSGQVYVIKTESSEHAETETGAVGENEQQEATTEKARPDSSEQKEHARAPEVSEHPQSETNTQSSKGATEQISNSEQQAEQSDRPREMQKPRSKSHEDVPEESSEQKSRPDEPNTQKEYVETKPEEGPEKEEKQEQKECLWPSLFPETREDRIQRMAREWNEQTDRVWESLTEVEKESFKEKIRRRLQDEEDFEDLVTRYGQEGLRDDEEAREEIERYLYFRERLREELDEGEALEEVIDKLAEELHINPEVAEEWTHYQSLPEELRDLMARETQYRWRELLRSIGEAEPPESIEAIREAFDDMLLDDELEYLKAWLETIAMRKRGEIKTKIRDEVEVFDRRQIMNIASKYSIEPRQIVYWLRGWDVPKRILALQSNRETISTQWKPKSLDELEHYQDRILNTSPEDFVRTIHYLHTAKHVSERKISKELGISRNRVRKAIRDWEVHERYYSSRHTLKRISIDLRISIIAPRLTFRKYGWRMQVQTARRRLDDSEIRKLHYEKGLTFVQIAQYSGMELDSIREAIGTEKANTIKGEIWRLYFQEGLSFDEITENLNISLKTIQRTFRANNWEFRVSAVTLYLDPEWASHLYYVEGFSVEEIAEILGVDVGTVLKLFHGRGWRFRGNQEAVPVENIALERRQTQRERRKEIKSERDRIFGTKCYACGVESKPRKSHHLHRKDGMEHDRHLFRSLKRIRSLNPDEWVLLCPRCHLGVHMLMKVFEYEWKRIDAFLNHRIIPREHKETLELPSDDVLPSVESRALPHGHRITRDELKKALFGESCSLCGHVNETSSLTLHRKDGKRHKPAMTTRMKYIEKLKLTNWAAVCHECHIIAQWALDKLGIDWSTLVELLKSK